MAALRDCESRGAGFGRDLRSGRNRAGRDVAIRIKENPGGDRSTGQRAGATYTTAVRAGTVKRPLDGS